MTWKQVVVIPVIKCGDHTRAGYLQINTYFQALSYCVNKIVLEQLTKYLNTSNFGSR